MTLFLFPFTVHFISIKPVLSNHLSYVNIFHCSLGRSHKTGLTVITKTGTQKEFVDEILVEVLFISMHLFTATWQYQQLGNIKENIPDN